MFLNDVIAYAILKAIFSTSDVEYDDWTKCPYTFVGVLNNKYCKTKKVIVNSYDKTVKIICDQDITARELSKIAKIGDYRLSSEDDKIILRMSWR